MTKKRPRLAYSESIADLWGYPDAERPRRPSTEDLFRAIVSEARGCLHSASWEDRIRRIENILCVVKERMRRHWEEMHESQLDRLVNKAKKEVDRNVG